MVKNVRGIRCPLVCNQILIWDEICGGPKFRTLGSDTFCTTHYSRWLLDHTTRDPRNFTGIHSFGCGVQSGVLCLEYGHGWAELTCWACGAEWVGVIGDPCFWCEQSLQRMLNWQAELVLRPPELELHDIRRPRALEAWKERLKVAREAGIITKEEANSVFGRELRRT